MRKRILSLLLAALTVLSAALTLVPVTANEALDSGSEETTLTYDDLYVDGATYKWDAYNLTAGESVTSFENALGENALSMKGTVGNKFVTAKGNLNLSPLLVNTAVTVTGEGGSTTTTYTTDDVTFEIVLHQHWDDEFAATLDLNSKQYFAAWKGNTLIKRYAEAKNAEGYLEWTTQDPQAENLTYPGYIKAGVMTTLKADGSANPANFNTDTASSSRGQFYANELLEPFTIGYSFEFHCDAEYPYHHFGIYRDATKLASQDSKYFASVSQKFNLFPAEFMFGYYAIRAYDKVLTEEELQQNHFADLAKYFGISDEALKAYAELPSDYKAAMNATYAAVNFNDTGKDALESAILNTAETAAKATLMATYDTLYVDGATYRWDAYSYTENSEALSAFISSVGDTSLSMSGTPYDRYVRSTSALSFTNLMTTETDGNGNVINDNFTVEVVAKQIYDDAFAAVMTAGQKFTGTGYLLRRWADTRMEITTKVPTYDEANGTYADGFINTVPLVYINPTSSKTNSWGSNDWLGAKIGQVYSFGASLAFDADAETPAFHVQLLRDGTVLKETNHLYTLSATKQKLGITDKADVICMGYYAIRAYDRVLKPEEMLQNHFADLVKYFDIGKEAFETLNALDQTQKTALYQSFADITFDETTKEKLTEAIAAAEANITSEFLTDNGIFLFDGYSSRLYVDPAIRASFTVDTEKLSLDGVTVIEMGTLSAMKGARSLENLTVSKNSDGEYAPTDGDVAHNVIYENGTFSTTVGEDGKLRAHQTVSFDKESATKDEYNVDYIFRGYAIVKANDDTYVLYTDMASARFGEEISMYELASERDIVSCDMNKDVINLCIQNPEKKTFRMLAIGNSFSRDSSYRLYDIAKNQGYEDIVIGVLYIGGCSIKAHENNAHSGEKAYTYYKYDNTSSATSQTASLDDGLLDEPWDFIVTHQVSHLAGTAESYTNGLSGLAEYVLDHAINYNVKLYWTMTWAYALSHTHSQKGAPGFEFLDDQDEYDHRISSHTQSAVMPLGYFDGYIPAGKAIRNAREHYGYDISDTGLYTSPDGYHLNARGQLISALTWFAALTGEDISDCTVTASGLVQADLDANIAAVKDALANPFYTKE